MDATIGEPSAAAPVERDFEGQPLPGAWGQVTLRAMAIAVLLGVVFCFVALRIHMTVGIVPGFNMPASVLSFYGLKGVTTLLRRCGIVPLPFTRQENVFLLSSVNICTTIAVTGGFATYIIGMTSTVAKTLVDEVDPREIVEQVPTGQWMFFLLLTGLMGILSILPFKEVMIVDYRLLFPMGTVTAHLINSFHTPQGAYIANLQVMTLLKSFIGSFSWSLFQWFYTAGRDCGFQSFPAFGLELFKRRFYFDFSATYIGLGMICPQLVNFSLLFGSIISWGFLYPYLESKKGQWYQTDSPSSMDGSNGYKVFLGITMILTDGIFNFLTLIVKTSIDFYHKRQENDSGMNKYMIKDASLNYDDRKRIEVFLDNRIPVSVPLVGYIALATICSVVIPFIFYQIKFYHVAALYIIAPLLSFCNAYGTGLTDWSLASIYSKFMMFIVAAWIGNPGAIIASLVSCGIIVVALHVSAQVMQDLKTGYMTITSSRAMITGQIFGVIMGSIINPCIFLAFQTTATANAPVGSKESEYPCPYANVYRAIGLIGMGGVNELPDYCVVFCLIAFFITIAINSIRLVSQKKGWAIQSYIPSMTAIAIPFFTGSFFTIDMCLGSVLLLIWTKINSQSAQLLSSALAAGLICGEGLFQMPIALLSIFKVHPPICMKFIPSGKEVEVVDAFLKNLETPTRT
ncbi:hypothetical protein ABZP36_014383 [Zizania latifolia]